MHMSAQRIRSLALSFVPVLAVVALTGALLASDPRVARAGVGKLQLHVLIWSWRADLHQRIAFDHPGLPLSSHLERGYRQPI